MNIKLLVLIITLMLPSTGFTKENTYVIDQSHFSLGFLVEHAGYAKTLGMFRHIDGSFNHDDDGGAYHVSDCCHHDYVNVCEFLHNHLILFDFHESRFLDDL